MGVVFRNLLVTIAEILKIFVPIIGLLKWIIIIRVILSWVNADSYNFLVQIIYRISDSLLAPFRTLVPSYKIGLDLSPICAILALLILQVVIMSFFVPTLIGFAMNIAV